VRRRRSEIGHEGGNFFLVEAEVRHSNGARGDERTGVGFAAIGDHICEVRAHVAAKAIELMARGAVVLLIEHLPMTGFFAHWFTLTGSGAAGVDRG
jgi:hypothetical protein